MNESGIVEALQSALPEGRVATGMAEIVALTRDQSWLSPSHTEQRKARQASEGRQLGVAAAVAPRSIEELSAAVGIAVRARTPITLRAAGTSNFGLIDPSAGGLLFDLRGIAGQIEVKAGSISARAGSVLGDMERAARAEGAEIPILTTTYPTATVGGWIAGGHVGLGSSSHGTIWDGIVRSIDLMTLEETPRVLTLTGRDVEPVLHTFGVTGIITRVELATVPARRWVETVGSFPDFASASRFTTALSSDPGFAHRVVAAQEPASVRGLSALGSALTEGEAPVLAILDDAQLVDAQTLAEVHGGRLLRWQDWSLDPQPRPSIATLVYGHRLYWLKRMLPDASFLHVYPDPADPDRDLAALKARFGPDILIESKFIRSPWMLASLGFGDAPTLPAAVVAVRHAHDAPALQAFCDEAGIAYQNPHAHTVEDNGLFADVRPIVAFKAQTDPHNLVHRGRLVGAEQKP